MFYLDLFFSLNLHLIFLSFNYGNTVIIEGVNKMTEPIGRLNSISLIHESTETENKVLDLLIKNGCSKEDLVNVSSMLQTIYMCGFEVGKRCVKE